MGFRHACIYPLVVPFRLYGKKFAGTFFVPSRQSGIPVHSTGIQAKAGSPVRTIETDVIVLLCELYCLYHFRF